jgi:ribosome-associated translation inhibitor RaiA
MQVHVRTDNHVNGSAGLTAHVESVVEESLARFGNRVTRVEVHLGDENSHKKSGDDKRCAMEARPAGMQPIAVTAMAASVGEAIDAATAKLVKSLDRLFDKKFDAKGRPSTGELANVDAGDVETEEFTAVDE